MVHYTRQVARSALSESDTPIGLVKQAIRNRAANSLQYNNISMLRRTHTEEILSPILSPGLQK